LLILDTSCLASASSKPPGGYSGRTSSHNFL
jgi:hypothetical protein